MKVSINRKFAVDGDGGWMALTEVPSKVLLEVSDEKGEPSGKPAIKINQNVFHFGQPLKENVMYRVLAIGTLVVVIQE